MSSFLKKFNLIYLPFLFIAIVFIPGYTFLKWLLFINLRLFSFKDMIINFGLPMALPWIPLLIWLRPRIKLLRLEVKNGNLITLYLVIAWLAIAAPTIVAQYYIDAATGKLTALNTINDIAKNEETKYYSLKNYYIDKRMIGVHPSFDVSGKYSEDFNMHLYVVLPIMASEADTASKTCLAWLGAEYYKRISNNLDE